MSNWPDKYNKQSLDKLTIAFFIFVILLLFAKFFLFGLPLVILILLFCN